MKFQYLYLTILFAFFNCIVTGLKITFKHELTENSVVFSGQNITLSYTCDAKSIGTLNTMMYCEGSTLDKSEQIDCSSPKPISLIVPGLEKGSALYYVYYADFEKEGGEVGDSPTLYVDEKSDKQITSNTKDDLKKKYSNRALNSKAISEKSKAEWNIKTRNVFTYFVSSIIILFISKNI
ncbi:hypothetical protein PIROE2DRAFT_8201 [Piromyces sp. E2]|nr:hypothetical protein PIROE2DRAFT_8201 [Piromyces sp. E2]|eukprot:OUM64891.1 hypothetical protein PIROE2DRAFT_8201 [Piromyces sp. E2]